MWGKPSTECDSLSFFKPLVPLLQVGCQTLLCLPTCTYKRIEQLVTTTHRLSLSVPVLPSVIVKEMAIHEFTGLPVRQYAVNLTHSVFCYSLNELGWNTYLFGVTTAENPMVVTLKHLLSSSAIDSRTSNPLQYILLLRNNLQTLMQKDPGLKFLYFTKTSVQFFTITEPPWFYIVYAKFWPYLPKVAGEIETDPTM